MAELPWIRAVAERVGLSERTIRRYRQANLVRPSMKVGRFALYAEEDVERLRLSKDMCRARFSRDETERLITALEMLHELPVGDPDLPDALDRLSAFYVLVATRSERLADELHAARSVSDALRCQLDIHQRRLRSEA